MKKHLQMADMLRSVLLYNSGSSDEQCVRPASSCAYAIVRVYIVHR